MSTELEQLRRRLEHLEAREAIRELKTQYLWACDTKQVEVIRDCFIEGELVIDYGPVGRFSSREAFIAVFEKFACNERVHDIHIGANPRIELLGDERARGRWSLQMFQINRVTDKVLHVGGYYEDEYRRIDGAWRMSSTVFTPLATQLLALQENAFEVLLAGRSLAELKKNR